MRSATTITGAVVFTALVAHTVFAQSPPPAQHHDGGPMPHQARTAAVTRSPQPSQSGQAAFAAVAEVVRLLDADPNTDWSRVDLERLRQHLVDMNEVVLHADVKQAAVPGGLVMDVTGAGRTLQAIQGMVTAHAAELDRLPAYAAKAERLPDGVRLTVTAKHLDDARAVARLRGLGFIGLLTEGAHHAPHHLAIARGEAMHQH